jgi:hypothetical protein
MPATGKGKRGAKNPGCPSVNARPAAHMLAHLRDKSCRPSPGRVNALTLPIQSRGWQIAFQKPRKASMRFSCGLPAMIAVFSAPIETPAIQPGSTFASTSPSTTRA